MRTLSPGIKSDFYAPTSGRDGTPPLYPMLWQNCIGAWCPCTGISGHRLDDWSGNMYTGKFINSPTYDVNGSGVALLFDNPQADCVDVDITRTLVTNKLSISCWIRARDLGAYRGLFLGLDPRIGLTIGGAGTCPIAYMWEGTSDEFAADTGLKLVLPGIWEHVALTISPTAATLYLNGRYSWTNTKTHTAKTVGQMWRMSQDPLEPNRTWDGWIDDLRLYNRTLSREEIWLLSGFGGSEAAGRGIAYRKKSRTIFTAVTYESSASSPSSSSSSSSSRSSQSGGKLDFPKSSLIAKGC